MPIEMNHINLWLCGRNICILVSIGWDNNVTSLSLPELLTLQPLLEPYAWISLPIPQTFRSWKAWKTMKHFSSRSHQWEVEKLCQFGFGVSYKQNDILIFFHIILTTIQTKNCYPCFASKETEAQEVKWLAQDDKASEQPFLTHFSSNIVPTLGRHVHDVEILGNQRQLLWTGGSRHLK